MRLHFMACALALIASAGWCLADPVAPQLPVSIKLDLDGGAGKAAAVTSSEDGRESAIHHRGTLPCSAGAVCTATYKVENVSKESFTDLLVHFYAVRIDKPGQAPPPLEPKAVVIETAATLDLAPGGATSAQLQFIPPAPGVYLVRIETPASDQLRGVTFAASLELIVK